MRGWLLDKSAAARSGDERVGAQLAELAGSLFLCPVGELEQLYSARSAKDYDALEADLRDTFEIIATPPDLFDIGWAVGRLAASDGNELAQAGALLMF